MGVRRQPTILLSLLALLWMSSHPASPPLRSEAPDRTTPPDPALAAAADFLARRGAGLTPSEITRTARAIVTESRRAELSPALVLAVIEVESGGDPFAVSHARAFGLMQLRPATAAEVAAAAGIPWKGPQTLFDPVVNVRLGVRYLAALRDRFGSVQTALAAYNWGPTHIERRRRGGATLPVVYPGRVLSAYERLAAAA